MNLNHEHPESVAVSVIQAIGRVRISGNNVQLLCGVRIEPAKEVGIFILLASGPPPAAHACPSGLKRHSRREEEFKEGKAFKERRGILGGKSLVRTKIFQNKIFFPNFVTFTFF